MDYNKNKPLLFSHLTWTLFNRTTTSDNKFSYSSIVLLTSLLNTNIYVTNINTHTRNEHSLVLYKPEQSIIKKKTKHPAFFFFWQ